MAAPKGNKNAKKTETSSAFLHLRCTARNKAVWRRAAKERQMRFSRWVTYQLNEASLLTRCDIEQEEEEKKWYGNSAGL